MMVQVRGADRVRGGVRAVLAKITHHDYSNKIKDKMAKFTKR